MPIGRGSGLTLLHVMPRLHPTLFVRAEPGARAALEALAIELRSVVAPGVDVFVAIESGTAYAEIATRAAAERAELIVVGQHHPRARLATTVDRLLRRGTTPLLVVASEPSGAYRRPLVAVDREGSCAAAIELMRRVIDPQVRGALAVHALDPYSAFLPIEYGLSLAEMAAYRDVPQATARAEIEPQLEALTAADFAFDLRCVEGAAAATVMAVTASERADLVVVGTHGRSGIGRWLLGSVAEAIIRDSLVDVLAVHSAA